jgi:hypothetical protein
MQTRLYSDLFGLIQAMLGINLSVIEGIRVKALINRRAQRAYRATNYWTRFLKVSEERDVINGTIAYQQSEKPTIDTFLRIYLNSQSGGRSSQEYEFTVTSAGASLILHQISSGVAFVTYKAAMPIYYGDHSYEEANIPYEWFQYIAHGVYADYLRSGGQQDRAAIADLEANEILTDELMRLDEQHTQTVISTRIFTNSNTSSRYGYGGVVGGAIPFANYTPPAPIIPSNVNSVLMSDGESQYWQPTETTTLGYVDSGNAPASGDFLQLPTE